MSAILIENEIVHYEVLGRGRPILFLHGWVGSWRYWIPTMQVASNNAFRAYALDFWGFGDTAKNTQRYSISEQVAILEAFFEQMGILKVALVGHGLGAVVGLQFAARNPERVDRFMAVSYPLSSSAVNPRLRNEKLVDLADWLLGRTPAPEPARQEAPKADPQALNASLQGLSSLDLWASLQALKTPCLLVHGQNDPAVSLNHSQEPAAELQESTHLIAFEASGHFPMLDEGAKFHRLLIDFLALKPGESPRQLQLKEEWKRRVR